jgi:hypothetical protein
VDLLFPAEVERVLLLLEDTIPMHIRELLPVLQLSIGPVIVISGVGLLLLSMTNRYGRVIDRSRILADLLRNSEGGRNERISAQLSILVRRARLLRLAITLSTVSVLLAACLIIGLFLFSIFSLEAAIVGVVLFIGCMGALIASLVVFLLDINASLAALELEVTP